MDNIEIGFIVIIVILNIIIISFIIILSQYFYTLTPERPLTRKTAYEYFYKLQPKLTMSIEKRIVDEDKFLDNINNLSNYKLFKILSGAEKI